MPFSLLVYLVDGLSPPTRMSSAQGRDFGLGVTAVSPVVVLCPARGRCAIVTKDGRL